MDGGETWERLDSAAVTPTVVRAAATDAGPGAGAGRADTLRLRRSRRPVLAALDGGGAILQRRLRDVSVGSSLILVPAVALNVCVSILGADRFDPSDSPLPAFLEGNASSGTEDVVTFVAIVFVSLVTAVVGHLCAQILLGERFARPVGLRAALRNTLRKLPAIVVAWVLTHWWFPLMALIVVTADTDLVGVWILLFGFLAWFSSSATLMVIPAMVGEGIGPYAAAKRNWRLVRLRSGTCLGFVALATVLSSLLLTGVATLVPLLEESGFVVLGSFADVVQSVSIQLGVLVVVPLVALGTAQLYVELRVDGEGLDLRIDADSAFGRIAPVPVRSVS